MRPWPWVSRYRLEEAERRWNVVDAERLRLLDLLLGRAAPERRVALEAGLPGVEPEDGIRPMGQGSEVSTSFTTPIDRVLARFDQAHRGGRIPVQFKARMN